MDWVYGVTRKHKIRNENNESGAGFQKDHERQLKWYSRVMRGDEEHTLREVLPYKPTWSSRVLVNIQYIDISLRL